LRQMRNLCVHIAYSNAIQIHELIRSLKGHFQFIHEWGTTLIDGSFLPVFLNHFGTVLTFSKL